MLFMRTRKQKIILTAKIIVGTFLVLIIALVVFRNMVLQQTITKVSNKMKLNYNCSFSVKEASFVGLSGLSFSKIILVPKNADTTFIINNKWFQAAHIDNYIAQPLQLDFIAIGKLEDIHTYAWLNQHRKQLKKGDDAYFITFSNSSSNPEDLYAENFQKMNKLVVVTQYRNHLPVRKMLVYLIENYKD